LFSILIPYVAIFTLEKSVKIVLFAIMLPLYPGLSSVAFVPATVIKLQSWAGKSGEIFLSKINVLFAITLRAEWPYNNNEVL